MFKAILFDLDGTLLNINMDSFLQYYFRKMIHMAREQGFEAAEKLVEQVYRSTDVMIADRDPGTTNEEVFMRDFFRDWPHPREEFEPFFEKFYEEGFPQLKDLCAPFKGVPQMMGRLLERGHRLVIATNAVFPMTALQHRIDWAGLGDFDFELVTSYEIMHSCKPHVDYYREVAQKIGVHPEECLMVGNDMGEDLPAGQLGMKTFLVEDMLIDKDVDFKPDWRGRLPDLFHFLDQL